MLPNMLALPREHWHSLNVRSYLGFDIEQIGVDLATIKYTVEKLLFVRQ